VLKKFDGYVVIFGGKNQVFFTFGNYTVLTRLVDIQFPKYRDAYESLRSGTRVELTVEALREAVDRMMALVVPDFGFGSLRLSKGKLNFRMSSVLGKVDYSIALKYHGEIMDVGVRWPNLLDFLKVADGKELELELCGDKKPIMIRCGDTKYFISPSTV